MTRSAWAVCGLAAFLATACFGGGGSDGGTGGGGGTNGTVTGGTGETGGTGTGGTSGDVCADCCNGIPNPSCAFVRCDCPNAGAGGTGTVCADGCLGLDCCEGACVNLQNDIKNCGECGNECPGSDTAYCGNGTCGAAPCDMGMTCFTGTCCGSQCCSAGDLCCSVPGPIAVMTTCVAPNAQGTCPLGCVLCDCNSPDTPIATPMGDRPIASLREGDFVYSVEDDATVVVPLVAVVQNPVMQHEVVRVVLDTGARLEISARHALVDGRTFGDLREGDVTDGGRIVAVETVPYAHPVTHDILPSSTSGAYYAGGVLVRSTLSPR